ncbi:MAG TPA: alpha/beta hydrolase [Xanthomonadaceae bacterium]|nr:alpha/beta hydrolase [Xanthomonadaceae bacterium]
MRREPGRPALPALALAALAALGLAACSPAYFVGLNASDGPTPAQTRVYDPERGLAVDIVRPAGGGSGAPVVVFFHGGGWQSGTRGQYRFVADALAARGLVVALPDYRKHPQVRFPAFVEDGARAVAYVARHARAFGGDPDRVFLSGHSAGAHIAALLATDARYLTAHGIQPRELAGVIGVAGPYDFLPLSDPALKAVFGPEAGRPASQPVNFVDGDEPPFLLLHGERDRRVWLRNSESLARALREARVPVQLQVYAGVGHARILSAYRFQWLAPTVADSVEFVERHATAR